MTVGGIRAEQMDPADVAWLHMDRPTNLMVVNTVLWFDEPVDQAAVLQVFQERVVWRFRRFRQRAADPALTLAPWAAPQWVDDAGFAVADHVSRTRLPAPGDHGALQQAASDLAGRPLRKVGRCGNCTCSTAMAMAARCCCAPTTPSPTAAP
jgi:diacylglycerol O-acyltransferase / wax synthase